MHIKVTGIVGSRLKTFFFSVFHFIEIFFYIRLVKRKSATRIFNGIDIMNKIHFDTFAERYLCYQFVARISFTQLLHLPDSKPLIYKRLNSISYYQI